jgi:hypothetical protein
MQSVYPFGVGVTIGDAVGFELVAGESDSAGVGKAKVGETIGVGETAADSLGEELAPGDKMGLGVGTGVGLGVGVGVGTMSFQW